MVVNHMLTCMNDLHLVIYMLCTCYVLIFESVHEKLLQKLLRKIENLLEICKLLRKLLRKIAVHENCCVCRRHYRRRNAQTNYYTVVRPTALPSAS